MKQRLRDSAGGPSDGVSPATCYPCPHPLPWCRATCGGGVKGIPDSSPAPDHPPTFSSARSTAGHSPRAWTDGGRGLGPGALRQCPARVWSVGCCPAPCLCPGPREGQGCACGADLVSTPLGRRQCLGVNSPRIKVPNCPGQGWGGRWGWEWNWVTHCHIQC